MKRFHLHVGVTDIESSKKFYSRLFASEPAVVKPDYAKGMLDDPRLNFAISQREGAAPGIDHVGVQVEDRVELAEVYASLRAADRPVLEEGATTCCYARSEKSWIADPDGLVWEAFLTQGDSDTFGDSPDLAVLAPDDAATGSCCTATTPQGVCCPPKPELAPDAPCCGP